MRWEGKSNSLPAVPTDLDAVAYACSDPGQDARMLLVICIKAVRRILPKVAPVEFAGNDI